MGILGPYHTSGKGRESGDLVGRAVGGLTPRLAGIFAGSLAVTWPRQILLPGSWACLSGKIALLVEGPTENEPPGPRELSTSRLQTSSSREVDFSSRFRVLQQVFESILIRAHSLRYLADTTKFFLQALLKAGPKRFTFLFWFFFNLFISFS